MGKLFDKKRGYSDEEYDDLEDDENLEDDGGLEDDEGLEDDDYDEDLENDEESEDNDGLEDDEELGDDGGLEDDEEPDDDDDEEDDDDDDDDDEDDDDEDDDEDDEETEEDRREYRRKRRMRNQMIAYSVVAVLFMALVGGGVALGSKVVSSVKEKKQAEELARQEQEAEEQEAEPMVIDTPEPIAEPEEEDLLGGVAEKIISEMPLEDKVAGLFIVTPESITGVATATQAGNGTQEALNQYAVGGLIYFSQNILDREQITKMLSNAKAMSRYPIFLAVDEEGGAVSRVANSSIEVTKVEDMAVIGAGQDPALARESGETIGSYLTDIGFNLDFAPVADVVPEGGNDVLGDRSFGSDPEAVGNMVGSFVEGIEGTGVSSCLKHFPGLGEAQEDTHESRAEITKSPDEMKNSDLVPFRAGIEAGADFVMVSHVTASGIDQEGVPSSLSEKVITDILRNELGFEGIIITDALNMTAITDYYTSEEAAVMAIEAGADMLLMPEDFTKAYEALLAAVQEGTISEERINDSLRRIYRVKYADKLE